MEKTALKEQLKVQIIKFLNLTDLTDSAAEKRIRYRYPRPEGRA
jgi:hypothetical protein